MTRWQALLLVAVLLALMPSFEAAACAETARHQPAVAAARVSALLARRQLQATARSDLRVQGALVSAPLSEPATSVVLQLEADGRLAGGAATPPSKGATATKTTHNYVGTRRLLS
jgi:hypothetical protein